MSGGLPGRVGEMPVSLGGHHGAAAGQAAAALEQLREKPESGEPPEKKRMLMDQQRLVQHALQQNLLAMATRLPMNIKLNNRDDRQETPLNLSTSGISSINMSIEINGVVYTGVLFAKKPSLPMMLGGHQNHTSSQGKTSLGLNYSCVQIQPSCSSSSSTSSTSSVHGPGNSSP
ncbi:AT-rich interactive domain-containing protein 3A-like isoform 2-T2 [Salvelinus alpinus]